MVEIKFSNPPLTEVICGIAFDAPEFSTVHFGVYWEKIRDRFPVMPTDKPPIAGGGLSLSAFPPLRRVWFESIDKKGLVQLQSDHFYYNWRKQDDEDSYPSFANIYPLFVKEWNEFRQWWTEDVGLFLLPVQYELTYINQINKKSGWRIAKDNKEIFTFTGRDWNGFLKPPESHIFSLQFGLPENSGTLSVSGNQALSVNGEEAVMVLELTARSLDADSNLDEWFNLAHEYIVKSFLDLTQKSIHKKWGLNE